MRGGWCLFGLWLTSYQSMALLYSMSLLNFMSRLHFTPCHCFTPLHVTALTAHHQPIRAQDMPFLVTRPFTHRSAYSPARLRYTSRRRCRVPCHDVPGMLPCLVSVAQRVCAGFQALAAERACQAAPHALRETYARGLIQKATRIKLETDSDGVVAGCGRAAPVSGERWAHSCLNTRAAAAGEFGQRQHSRRAARPAMRRNRATPSSMAWIGMRSAAISSGITWRSSGALYCATAAMAGRLRARGKEESLSDLSRLERGRKREAERWVEPSAAGVIRRGLTVRSVSPPGCAQRAWRRGTGGRGWLRATLATVSHVASWQGSAVCDAGQGR